MAVFGRSVKRQASCFPGLLSTSFRQYVQGFSMTTAVKERPILMNAEMVRATLDGRKTQTRRVIKNAYFDVVDGYDKSGELWNSWVDPGSGALQTHPIACPYGVPGDELWVCETTAKSDNVLDAGVYVADRGEAGSKLIRDKNGIASWGYSRTVRPAIHMPRWASRIQLRITDIRVERVQDITPDDVYAEGAIPHVKPEDCQEIHECVIADYWIPLWDSINAERGYGWDANPWVWVVEFEKL